jgi:YidC/Oxa1 family membrane protein insertase
VSNPLNPIYKAIGYLLAVAYSVVPAHNLGLAIILLTCVVMLALFPLTAKQARSMISMQKVQPEIKRLQQKYKNDKQKQNEEILKFYQENKINPLAGCLPLVMQFPIFISLFHVLRSVQANVPKAGSFNRLYTDICGTGAKCQKHPTGLRFLGMDLSKSLWNVRTGSIVGTIPYVISILLIIGTGWYQARQTMARTQNNANASPVNSQMQFMTKVFPVVFGVLSLRFASGLVVYWVTSNLWRIGQQHLVLNKIYDEANKAPAPKSSVADDIVDDDPPPPSSAKGSGGPKGSGTGGPKGSSGGPKGSGASGKPGAAKAPVRRPGSPKPARNPNRGGSGNGSGSGSGSGNGAGSGSGSGNGAATPASAGNRRKKRKR